MNSRILLFVASLCFCFLVSSSGPAQADEVEATDHLYYYNVGAHYLNYGLYKGLVRPLTVSYDFVVHDEIQVALKNFFDNLQGLPNALKHFFLLDFEASATETKRFVINSIVGFGFFNPASDYFAIEKRNISFSQNLGCAGIGHGTYLVLPFFGASSLRNTVGLGGDLALSPTTYAGNVVGLVPSGGMTVAKSTNNTVSMISFYDELYDSVAPYEAIKKAFEDHDAHKLKQVCNP